MLAYCRWRRYLYAGDNDVALCTSRVRGSESNPKGLVLMINEGLFSQCLGVHRETGLRALSVAERLMNRKIPLNGVKIWKFYRR
jgi:hypothetical protein